MKIIDCSACIGLGSVNRMIINHENYFVYEKVKQARHAADLITEMDYCGIAESYVYHQAMFDTDPIYGNHLICDEVRADKSRLHATWTVLPPITESFFSPDKLLAAMKANQIKALRAFPHRNRYFLDKVTMGDLLDSLSQLHIPLFLSPQDEWRFLYDVLKEFPKLTLIISNYGLWGSDRYVFPLIRNYENVYLETSDYQLLCGIANFVQQFGSERLLFGSNFPLDNIGGPLCCLLGSDISLSEIENIAYKNIEEVMRRSQV